MKSSFLDAIARRVERRIGRPLHWWELDRLNDVTLAIDGVAAKCRALAKGNRLTTFRLGAEPHAGIALTWTTEAA